VVKDPQLELPRKPDSDEVALVGSVVRVTFENDESSFRVVKMQPDQGEVETVIGVFAKVSPGETIRVTGVRERGGKFGDQIRAQSVTALEPQTRVGLARYLGSGIVKGLGERLAERIVEAFGDETLGVLDAGGGRLSEVRGISKKAAKSIGEAWQKERQSREALVFLRGHDLPPALALKIVKRYGERTIVTIRDNPYRLANEIAGVGFLTADRIAETLGVSRDDPARLEAGVLHVLTLASENGHTFVERGPLARRTATELAQEETAVLDSIDRLAARRRVILVAETVRAQTIEGLESTQLRVFLPSLYRAETGIAEGLAALLASQQETPLLGADLACQEFEKRTQIDLAEAQRQAIHAAAKHGVLVLTGGPGVGKTTIVRALLGLYARAKLTVRLAAPTGRAAKRMTESTGTPAVTLHRLLEVDAMSGRFQRDSENPLEADAVIVDEASMLDVTLARSLVEALPPRCRLVLVGDVDQLPSVGPGAVLRDLLDSGTIPSARLSVIFRQAETSLIVKSAHQIREGIYPDASREAKGDFFLIERENPEDAVRTLRHLVTERVPNSFGFDPVRDLQVLAPMKKGAAGVIALNEMLQQALNPTGPSVTRGAQVFRLGDKVMQLKNDYDREVYNGDIGTITALNRDTRSLDVSIDDRTVVYGEKDLDDLTLAYATSVHKAQGSEYPVVLIPWLRQHFAMLSRNLLYTAVTRGKKLVILVADPQAIRIALNEDRREERSTSLADELRRQTSAKPSS
jgi:exodeoxyribonuclease V alpha subunit